MKTALSILIILLLMPVYVMAEENGCEALSKSEQSAMLSEFGTTNPNDVVCLDIIKADLNKNGIKETIVVSSGSLCGSCHAVDVYIIENAKLVFYYEGDDLSATIVNGQLTLEEPVRQGGEPMCCPTQFQLTVIGFEDQKFKVVKKSIKK